MLEEADRLASLVDRLLTLSRAETGQATPSHDRVDLVELAENVIAHLGVLAEEKGQSLVVERSGTPEALGDRVALRQALINLGDNAIKFTPAGGRIRVRVTHLVGGEPVVEVIDSGQGVRPELRARIFDRFYRGDDAPGAGTGLGLSIAKGAVEASGGHLTLEATGPEGSTFRMSLRPAVEVTEVRARSAARR
jgi:signal transduction histidine kinase